MSQQAADAVIEASIEQVLELARFGMVGLVPGVENVGEQSLGQTVPSHNILCQRTARLGQSISFRD
jgi:hypothetical protein